MSNYNPIRELRNILKHCDYQTKWQIENWISSYYKELVVRTTINKFHLEMVRDDDYVREMHKRQCMQQLSEEISKMIYSQTYDDEFGEVTDHRIFFLSGKSKK